MWLVDVALRRLDRAVISQDETRTVVRSHEMKDLAARAREKKLSRRIPGRIVRDFQSGK